MYAYIHTVNMYKYIYIYIIYKNKYVHISKYIYIYIHLYVYMIKNMQIKNDLHRVITFSLLKKTYGTKNHVIF